MKKTILFLFVVMCLMATSVMGFTYDDAENYTHVVGPEQQGYGSMKTAFIDQTVEEVNNGDGASLVFSLITPSATILNPPRNYVLGRYGFDYLDGGFTRAYTLANTANGYERAITWDGYRQTGFVHRNWQLGFCQDASCYQWWRFTGEMTEEGIVIQKSTGHRYIIPLIPFESR